MFPAMMSSSTSVSQEGSSSSVIRVTDFASLINPMSQSSISTQQPQQIYKTNPSGNPDPEVIALSHEALLGKNRYICELCNNGFYRDQILQLHGREVHNLPLILNQRDGTQPKKKVYICPVPTCVHHEPSGAFSNFTLLKKHYTRKHVEKMWKCEKCPKIYALKSDWKVHSKTCGANKCDCGIIFSRENDLISHKAVCDALPAEESDRLTAATTNPNDNTTTLQTFDFNDQILLPLWIPPPPDPSPSNPMALPFEDLPEY